MRLICVRCSADYPVHLVRYRCDCGGTLDVVHNWLDRGVSRGLFDDRLASRRPLDRSGVWRFRELVLDLPDEALVTRGEGNTTVYSPPSVAKYVGLDAIFLKHEGENPTGSFKDRGMACGMSAATYLGQTAVACASTGNTAASLASFGALAGMQVFVFVPEGQIAYGKLGQSLAYGARTVQIDGDFDDAMRIAQELCASDGIYLLNSVNPFRLEGQKTIAFELVQDRGWSVPDWIVVPGGNLGNSSAIAKGMIELFELGFIDRLPRMAIVQASGANPLYTAFVEGTPVRAVRAQTVATAIQIGDPISWRKSLRGLRALDGVVTEVDDDAILDAKAVVDASGVGAEPASCATVAGLRRLVSEGVVKPGDDVVCILTGNLLKDPDVVVRYHRGELPGADATRINAPVRCEATVDAVRRALGR